MDARTEKLIDRIRKMLAIAQDARANPNEAANAAAMAEKLMRKHQIDHADLIEEELKDMSAFDVAAVGAVMKAGQGHKPSKVPNYAGWLAVEIAQLNDCGVRHGWTQELGACILFFGYKADIEVAKYTFQYLFGTLMRAVRDFQAEGKRMGWPRTKSESNSFRHGFIVALLRSLRQANEARKAENAQESSARALAVVKQRALEDAFGEFKYRKNKKGPAVRDAAAFSEGVVKGNAVDVNRRGLSGNNPDAILLDGVAQ